MSEPQACPHCGARQSPEADARGAAVDAVAREVRRLREVAETRQAAEQDARIERLTREVTELRATVARLRGTLPAPVPAPRPATVAAVPSIS